MTGGPLREIVVAGRIYRGDLDVPWRRGGMCRLFEVTDDDGRRWVLRTPRHPTELGSPDNIEVAHKQFEREGRILTGFNDPGIVWCEGYEHVDAFNQYMVLEPLEVSLDTAVGSLSVADVVDIGIQAASVLERLAQHDPPIVHRDVKPANLMYDAHRRLRLIDFGIARYVDEKIPHRSDTYHFASRGFAPPEQQWSEQQTGPESDVYGLGITLLTLLSGVRDRPLAPPSYAPARQHERTPRELGEEIRDGYKRQLAAGLLEVIATAVRYDRARRYPDGGALRRALVEVATDERHRLTPTGRTCPYCRGKVGLLANFCGVCGHAIRRDALEVREALLRRGLLYR